jgi:hypothetical protein
MTEKRCSRCKRSLTIHYFSPGEWNRPGSQSRTCAKCVHEGKNHSKNPMAGTQLWRRSMKTHFRLADSTGDSLRVFHKKFL